MGEVKQKKSWLKYTTRVVGMNPVTFKENWRFNINKLQLISVIFLFLFILFILFYLLFSFTPAGILLPENIKNRNKEKIETTLIQIDQLEGKVRQQEMFIQNLQNVILGNISVDSTYSEKDFKYNDEILQSDTSVSEAEKELNQQISDSKESSISTNRRLLDDIFLYDPLKGTLSQSFHKENHPGVDIIAEKDATVKSCLEGTVVHTSYDDKDGYTIIITHQNDITSVYKHIGKVLTKVGENVKTGDAIGVVGNTGERSSGPHLHFELWSNIGALNPLEYLSFGQ
jgi:murein DD-endopeptidase MepM/ murein hydrolase activator NlpD